MVDFDKSRNMTQFTILLQNSSGTNFAFLYIFLSIPVKMCCSQPIALHTHILLSLLLTNYMPYQQMCHVVRYLLISSNGTAMAQSVQRIDTTLTVRGSNPGGWGGEIFPVRPDQTSDPRSQE